MIKQKGGIAIALENCSALEVVDDQYRILVSKKSANVYRLYRKKGRVVEEVLPVERGYRQLKELLRV